MATSAAHNRTRGRRWKRTSRMSRVAVMAWDRSGGRCLAIASDRSSHGSVSGVEGCGSERMYAGDGGVAEVTAMAVTEDVDVLSGMC